MLTIRYGPGVPGIIEHRKRHEQDGGRRAGTGQRDRQRIAGSLTRNMRSQSVIGEEETGSNGISTDRLIYINTALDALPGRALRDYFVPIMRLQKQLLLRRRNTRRRFPETGTPAYAKMVADAVSSLVKSLGSAAKELLLDGGTASFSVDPKALLACLKDKLSPISMESGAVFAYPREPPETSFVYIILSGSVTATYFQTIPVSFNATTTHTSSSHRRTGSHRKERQTYFTSAKDVVRLCGGGAMPDAALASGSAEEAADGGRNHSTTAPGDTASNVTTAIQRSLRRASRVAGQPTLQFTRTDALYGPAVLGAAEALGLAPAHHTTYTAAGSATVTETVAVTATAMTAAAASRGIAERPTVDAFRVRTSAVHAALLQLAAAEQAERQRLHPQEAVAWCVAGAAEVASRGIARTIADFVAAARRRTLINDYAATEMLMRQSWLLQDAPSHAIRTLMSQMVPRTYMPGEVIACPHTPSRERQLCFLRRGRISVLAVSKGPTQSLAATMRSPGSVSEPLGAGTDRAARDSCDCWHLSEGSAAAADDEGGVGAEFVEAGASFGELSVLFQEPRHCVLRADTVCDAWCLPHRSFTELMQRDASLREGLLQKAAVLRIEWMGEQRFTRALAHQLRASSTMLRPLSDLAIRLIQERLEPVVYAPGSLVVSHSTRCNAMILIARGTLSSICDGVASYGQGDMIGEGCLVPHRWPLALAARTMVEGWRISVDQLTEALRRMNLLHHYSTQAPNPNAQWLMRIFGNPLPAMEVDSVGRQQMPTLEAAPGGGGYVAYGRAVSEIQLRATCVLFGDYAKWKDISYISEIPATAAKEEFSRRALLERLAHELAMHELSGSRTDPSKMITTGLASSLNRPRREALQEETIGSPVAPQPSSQEWQAGTGAAAGAAQTGAGAANVPHPPPPPAEKSAVALMTGTGGRDDEGRPAAGSGHSAVRATKGSAASARGLGKGADGAGRRARRGSAMAGAFLVKRAFLRDEGLVRAFKGSGGTGSEGGLQMTATSSGPMAPRLHRMTRLLEERNRLWAAEQRHEAVMTRQESRERDTAMREQVAALQASTAAATTASGRGGGAATTAPGPGSTVLRDVPAMDVAPAPVHIFLQGDNPTYEVDLQDAIAIGYVMQLPNIASIQYSVSLVDPDVALGPPAHRARRRLMAMTPNDRHTKHNFLFAAAMLEDSAAAEAQHTTEAKEAALAMAQSKARKLYAMMRISIAARVEMEGDMSATSGPAGASGDFGSGTMAGASPESLMRAESANLRTPMRTAHVKEGAEEQEEEDAGVAVTVSSPLIADHTPNPERGSSGSVVAVETPSPFRGTPGKSGAQRSAEGFQRLMQRDPTEAVEMLRRQYGMMGAPRGMTSVMTGNSAGGLSSVQSSPGRAGPPDSMSVNTSAISGVRNVTSADSARRVQKPSNLDRLMAVVTGKSGSGAATKSVSLCGVRMTDVAAVSFPEIVQAVARDRWHCVHQLSPASAEGAAAPMISALSEGNEGVAGYVYETTHHRQPPVIFMAGFGFLTPLPPTLTVYPPSGKIGDAGARGLLSRTVPVGKSRRRSSSRVAFNGLDPNEPLRDVGVFVMPTLEDTAIVVQRIQRDVNGLNAVARDQRGDRENATGGNGRRRQGRSAQATVDMEAILSHPDAAELEVVEGWRGQYRRLRRDSLQRASLPQALRAEAGPDYVHRELQRLANAVVPGEDTLLRYTSEIQIWQGDQQPLHPHPPLIGMDGGEHARSGPRRVVAAIGAAELGYLSAPLQSPAAAMGPAEYQAWVQQREEFFAAYQGLPVAPSADTPTTGEARAASMVDAASALALAPPPLQFAPERPTSAATNVSDSSRRRGEAERLAARRRAATPAASHRSPAPPSTSEVTPNRSRTLEHTAALFQDTPSAYEGGEADQDTREGPGDFNDATSTPVREPGNPAWLDM